MEKLQVDFGLKVFRVDIMAIPGLHQYIQVGTHDKLGMQAFPLRLLTPRDTQEFSLDLVKNTNPNDPQNKKQRGQLVMQMRFNPFKEDNERFSGPSDRYASNESGVGWLPKHKGPFVEQIELLFSKFPFLLYKHEWFDRDIINVHRHGNMEHHAQL
ncbi:hypothetical protein DITRI_Ditri06bG0060800 [Diplodiscus trichospermus]